MELITVRELFKNTDAYAGKEIEIGGWVRNRRPSKQFGFIVLNDGTYFTPIQVVYNDTLENFQEISKINIGAALIVKGTLVLTPDSKQAFELQATQIQVEGPSTGDYPLQPKRHSMEFLRSISHLRPRTNTFQAVFPPAAPDQYLPGGVPCPQPGGHGHPQVLPGPGLRLRPHAPDHRL